MSTQAVSFEDLVAHFFECCDGSFDFLCKDYDFKKYNGMVAFHGGRKIIQPFKPRKKDEPQLVICRLEKNEIAIELTYDNEHMLLDSYIYFDFVNRFSLKDIANAAKKNRLEFGGDFVISSPVLITKEVERVASSINKEPQIFTQYDDKLVERALNIRSKQMEHAIREQHKQDLSTAIEKAAKAYREKDYRRVVELYKPFEPYLKLSDKKKYQRAVKELTDAH